MSPGQFAGVGRYREKFAFPGADICDAPVNDWRCGKATQAGLELPEHFSGVRSEAVKAAVRTTGNDNSGGDSG